MLEFIKIFKKNEELELQLSNQYDYSIENNKLVRTKKDFNTKDFFDSKIDNIFLLVGANGTGKTSLIYDINDLLNDKISRQTIIKYILVINIKGAYKIKTNLDIDFPNEWEKIERGEINKFITRAIYHVGIDGNKVEIDKKPNILDLSLNYKFQNNGNYQAFKEENVFNQLNLISQHPNLLSNVGIDNLNHPKKVSYSLNLEFLNNTSFKNYSNSYLVYIYESNYMNVYYELDKINRDNDFVFDQDWLVDLFEQKLFICTDTDFEIILKVMSILDIKLLYIQIDEIVNSYSRAAKNEIMELNDSIESNNFVVSTYILEIGTYFFENVFINFFERIIEDLNLESIIHEKVFNENFSINLDRFIEQIFETIEDLNFIYKNFYNEKYIEELTLNDEENFYMEAYDLYFGEDLEDAESEEEVREYKSRVYSNFKSINQKSIISNLEFINGEEPLKLGWEKNIESFLRFVNQIILKTVKKNIDISGFIFDEYLLDLGVRADPNYLLKNNNERYSKKILNEVMSNSNKVVTDKIKGIYDIQKKSIEYFLEFMNHSTRTSENLLSINTSSEFLNSFFRKYGKTFDSCIYKFEWRNMSSGEFAILNLLSSINNCNSNSEKTDNLILLVDEGDLYLHPQWQKQFIYILTNAVQELLEFKKVYILLTTHSPFLVSDIPNDNILFLNSVKNTEYNIDNTFAANINELLATKFFIQDGLIGKFAKQKINSLYNELVSEFNFDKIDYYKGIIEIIGEPLVKVELAKILNEKIQEYEYKVLISRKLEERNLAFDQKLLDQIYTNLIRAEE